MGKKHLHTLVPTFRDNQGAHEDQQGTNGNGLQNPNDGEFLGQTVAAWGQIMGEMSWEMGEIW